MRMNTFKTITAAELVSSAVSRSVIRSPFVGDKWTRPREYGSEMIERLAQEKRSLLRTMRVLRRGAMQNTDGLSEEEALFLSEAVRNAPPLGSIQRAWSTLRISAWDYVSYATRRRDGVILYEYTSSKGITDCEGARIHDERKTPKRHCTKSKDNIGTRRSKLSARGLVREAVKHTGDTRAIRWRDEEGSVMRCADVRSQFELPPQTSCCVALGDIFVRAHYWPADDRTEIKN